MERGWWGTSRGTHPRRTERLPDLDNPGGQALMKHKYSELSFVYCSSTISWLPQGMIDSANARYDAGHTGLIFAARERVETEAISGAANWAGRDGPELSKHSNVPQCAALEGRCMEEPWD